MERYDFFTFCKKRKREKVEGGERKSEERKEEGVER